ncbi:MAG TPA: FliH/SctL family protein [Solirubrobacteraceae bacterium]
MSETAVSYDFEQLEPAARPPRNASEQLLAEKRAVHEQARAEGHAEGRAAGIEEARAALASASEALGEALREIESMREQLAAAIERDAVELALALAGKILAGALQARPELVVEVVQGALRRVSAQRNITVLVNPADLETVTAAIGDLQSQANGLELCDMQPDQRVQAGSAIVRTLEGEVDAGIETQLERAREVAFAELSGEEHGA